MGELIFSDSPGELPAEYVLAPQESIAIQSVRALFDGSGAGGAFYPCLSVYSQDGKLIGRVRTDTAYQVGDTGEVTWAPFLRAPQTVSAAASATDFARSIVSLTTSGAGLTTATFGSWSGVATTPVFDVSAGSNPLLLAEGLYAIYLSYRSATLNPNVDTTLQFQFNRVGGGGNAVWSSQEPIGSILAFAEDVARVNQAGTGIDITAFSQPVVAALLLITALPGGGYEFNVQADQLEDEASKVATFDLVLTGMYFGGVPA